METRELSIREILMMTIDSINSIIVPMKYADSIARPLCAAVASLEACVEAMQEPEKTEEVNENV